MLLKYNKWIKIFISIFFAFSFIGCFYVWVYYPFEEEFIITLLIVVFIVLFCFHLFSLKYILDDKKVIYKNFITEKYILYKDVESVLLYYDSIKIISKKRQIKLTKDIEQNSIAIEFILEQIFKINKNILVKGDKLSLKKYIKK